MPEMKPFYHKNNITIYCAEWQVLSNGCLAGIDTVLTDPPYGIGVTKMTLGNGKEKIYRGSSEWDDKPPSSNDFSRLIDLSKVQIFWGGNYFANNLPPTRGWLVWDKGTGDNSFADCELAWTNIDIVVKKFFHSWVGANAKDTPERLHPTQKPVSLMHWCIGLANPKAAIFDPYMGSGPTIRAALDLGLPALGCERDEYYCKKAVERLRQPSFFSIGGNPTPRETDLLRSGDAGEENQLSMFAGDGSE